MMVEVENNLKKPGPVFNAMLREAYFAGADYYYRLNDDSELQKADYGGVGVSWPKTFMGALHKMGPPYGVVGPFGGLDRILTHDFVHRTHMEIFEQVYYPALLVDWYMDDWVSQVYGKDRSIKATRYNVEHHTYHHGQRYKVDRSNERHLKPEIKEGRAKISAYTRDVLGLTDAAAKIDQSTNPPPFLDMPCDDWTGLKCR